MPYQPAGNSGSGSKTAKMSQLKFWSKQNNNKQQEKQLQQDNNGGDNLDGSNNGSNNNGTNNTNNNSNSGNNNSSSKSDTKNNKRNWLHTPEQLINGHAVYLVKVSESNRCEVNMKIYSYGILWLTHTVLW